MNTLQKDFINMARWFAAIMVMLGHVRHLVLFDYYELSSTNILDKLFYFVTGFGHESVIVFFVLSGILVGGISYEKWSKKNSISITDYFISRFTRIYIVLIPALIFGYFIDNIGLHFFNNSHLYTNPLSYNTISLQNSISTSLNLFVLLGNVLNLQGLYVPILGTNFPLWSLAYETWYYIIFLIISMFFFKSINKYIFIVLISLFLIFLPLKLLMYFSIWLLGLLSYVWLIKDYKIPSYKITTIFLFLCLTYSRLSHDVSSFSGNEVLFFEYKRDLILAFSFCLFFISLKNLNILLVFSKQSKFLSGFSYSMYLIHFPVMIFISSFLYQIFGLQVRMEPNFWGYSYFIFMSVLLFLSSLAFWYFFERHTDRFRFFLSKKINSYLERKI